MKSSADNSVRLFAISCWLVVALIAGALQASAAATTDPPFAGISVVAEGAVTAPAVNVAHVDAGDVNALDTPSLVRTFELKNAGAGPLTIDRLQASCHCTTAQIAAGGETQAAGGSGLPITLAVGEVARVRVSVDLGILAPDDLNKTVAVCLQGATQPAALLEITGVLTPSLTLTPALIDFGTVAGGQEHTMLVTARADPRLAVAGKLPPLICSDAAVRVIEQPQPAPAQTGDWLTRTYAVTLPDTMPPGPVYATLTFGERASGSASGPDNADRAAVNLPAVFRTATALVIGRITEGPSTAP